MAEYDTATRWGPVHSLSGGIGRDAAAHDLSEGLAVEAVNALADREGYLRGRVGATRATPDTHGFGEFIAAQRDRGGVPRVYAWGRDNVETFTSTVRYINPADPTAASPVLYTDSGFPDRSDLGPAAYFRNVLVAGNKQGQWSRGGLWVIGTANGIAGLGDNSCRMVCTAGSFIATVTSGETVSAFEPGQIAVGNESGGAGRGFAVYVVGVSVNGSGQPVLAFDRAIDWSGNFDGSVTPVWAMSPLQGLGSNRSGRLPFSYGSRLGVANCVEFAATGTVKFYPRRVIYTALMVSKDFPQYASRIASVPIAELFLANNYIEIAGSGELTAVLPVQGGVLFFDLETVTRFEGAFVTQNGDIGGSFGQQYLLSPVGCLDARTLVTTAQGSIFLSRDGLMTTNGGAPEPLLSRYARDMLRDMLQSWAPFPAVDREASGALVRGHYVLSLKDIPEQLVVNLQNGHVTTWTGVGLKHACSHPTEPHRTYGLRYWDKRAQFNTTLAGGSVWELQDCFAVLDGMLADDQRTSGHGAIHDPDGTASSCDIVMRPQVEDAVEDLKRWGAVKLSFDASTNSDEDVACVLTVYGCADLDPRRNDFGGWIPIGTATLDASMAQPHFEDFTIPPDLRESSGLALRIVCTGYARFHLYSVRLSSQVRREGVPALA